MNQRKDYTSLLGVRAGKEQKLICTRWSYRVCVLGYMPMSACLCVSFHVSAWWMCVCIYVCVLIWAHVCEYIPMCVCVCVCPFLVCSCVHVFVLYICVCLCAHLCLWLLLCVCVSYMCAHVCIYMFSHCMCMSLYIWGWTQYVSFCRVCAHVLMCVCLCIRVCIINIWCKWGN